ncbi:MAG: ABC transporter ATP-binding protein [Chloroflexi bacterium]|nr:ABC transporter ATP-binding protein [Chloroflexota bacterium]
MPPLLDVRDIRTEFVTHDGVVRAVNGVSLHVDAGETLGIVGESGSGKSVSMLSVMRLIPQPPGRIVSGQVLFRGEDLLSLDDEATRRIRGTQIGMVFQDPMTFLNPVLTIGRQITETLEEHLGLDKSQARERALELLELVGIPVAHGRLDDYPHQFSGGMRQRAMIAMALCCNPSLLIADEPTTALDVTIQAQIIELVKRLRRDTGMAVIWITHDLGIIAGLADRVNVMYAGYVVETARVEELYANPRHPYTQGLLGSLPRLDARERRELASIGGVPPDMVNLPAGCPFAPRCAYGVDRCAEENPTLRPVAGDDHRIACWRDISSKGKAL